ncbi:CPBP family intramembrane glutamic endopeptidase [Companilactobacillus mishanensis]|uniref:CPBP family intramembrane metalloprotease n=1 Tax=Companilactobacillus mishanensis TaxID=2486008 RepID=A0A5P0ZIL3_9LACO|nr:type II CAAX endopeptidase family protein [Companilactobacillus mishanensis]MQS52920.1 CPBP family intramembrane metalloprotease [Companilactobacillus mishanensis]
MKNTTNQLVTLLCYLVLSVVGTILSALSITGHAYFGIITILSLVATVAMIYLVQKSGKNEFELPKFNAKKFVTWVLIGAIGAILIQIGLTFVEQGLLHIATNSQNTASMLTQIKGYPYYMLYVLICAPIMEEIVFRRIFFADLIRPTNIYLAIIISSVLFAFMHQDTRFVIYLLMGAWFCFVYYKSKNIYASATSHIIMNLVVFGLSIV